MHWDLGSVVWLVVLGLGFVMFMHLAKVQRDGEIKKQRIDKQRHTKRARWQRMARWMSIYWVFLIVVPVAMAADAEPGYVTADPGRSDRLGLATPEGRYSVELGDGCDAVAPGVNVVVTGDDLQVVDPLEGIRDSVCTLTASEYMSSVPCAVGPAGACDVAYA